MHWDELLFQIQDTVGEIIGEDTFHRAYCVTMAGALAQNYITNRIPCVEYDGEYNIPLVSGTGSYDLPVDMASPLSLSNDNTTYLDQQYGSARRKPAATGSPYVFRMGPKKLEVYPIPSGTGAAFTLADGNTDSTSSNYTVSAAAIVITIVGGVNAGAYTVDFATYTTIGAIVTRINALSKGLTATLLDSCPTGTVSTHLSVVTVAVALKTASVATTQTVTMKGTVALLKYVRETPTYALRLRDANPSDGTATASTASYFSVSETGLTFVVTGGTNAGSNKVDWATYTTVAAVVAKINALAKGVAAVICDNCPATQASNTLDVTFVNVPLKTTSSGVVTNYARAAFLKPELPNKLTALIIGAMFEYAKLKSLEIPVAIQYRNDWKASVERERALWINERNKGITCIRSVYGAVDSNRQNFYSVVW